MKMKANRHKQAPISKTATAGVTVHPFTACMRNRKERERERETKGQSERKTRGLT